MKEKLELINGRTEQGKRELKIEMLITTDTRNKLVAFLQEYIDVFAVGFVEIL